MPQAAYYFCIGFAEVLLWLIHSGQIDPKQRPGQRRFAEFAASCRSP